MRASERSGTMTTSSSWHVRWPSSRFYFDVLDTRGVAKRGRPTDHELGYILENSLPVPLERVHVVYRNLGEGKYLACAVDRLLLATELPPDALALTPDALPAFLGAVGAEPDELNLLHGEFEPAPIQASRRRRSLLGLAALATTVALLAFGMERRTRAAGEAASDIAIHESQVLHAALGPAPPTVPPAQRRMALVAERRRLERTRLPADRTLGVPDASDPLARVLAEWPENPAAQVEHLSVTTEGATIRGNAPNPAVAQVLADRLQQVANFTVEQPQFATARGKVLFTIRLRRTEGK